jgi:hypothetical protein
MQRFKVGDKVYWHVVSGGFAKNKYGVVVAVVPAGVRPEHVLPIGYEFAYPVKWSDNRDKISYLVHEVSTIRKVFWPVEPNRMTRAYVKELIDLLRSSIEHWERMIAWAAKRLPRGKANQDVMLKLLGESWGENDCPLCKRFFGTYCCARCPLVGSVKETVCCKEYYPLTFSWLTWEQWRKEASKYMLPRLKRELRKMLKLKELTTEAMTP